MSNNVKVWSYSDIGGRPENEDSCDLKIYGNSIVAVLADGLGGEGGGRIASSIACDVISKCGADQSNIDEDMVKQVFLEANEAICRNQSDAVHMKSTGVYLHISHNRAIWAHIGDSRLYYFLDGRLQQYTLDHSLAQLAVFLGDIERKDINTYRKRSTLFRALGSDDVDKDSIDMNSVVLEKGVHSFLLCSDGLWEYLSDQEIDDALAGTTDPEEWINRLRQLRNERADDKSDNNTAAAIMIEVM